MVTPLSFSKESFIYIVLFLQALFLTPSLAILRSTSAGVVEGRTIVQLGVYIHEFLGIPFAQSPTGELRFQPPKPVRSWDSLGQSKRALIENQSHIGLIKRSTTCTQFVDPSYGGFRGAEMWNPNTPQSEDCLYLNVWAPERAVNKSVLIWVYGGGFFSGSSTLDVYNGAMLAATQDIIVVSFQYRLHALGFAYLGTAQIPGNAGMLDQVEAFRWVQENIRNFGGDPNNVTIMGESAGGASVSLHLFSPLSRGKFHRAIMQSGFAIGDWVTLSPQEAKTRTIDLARVLCRRNPKFDYNDLDSITECLLRANASEMQNTWVTGGYNQFPHVPVIDGKFLLDRPKALLARGEVARVPMLLGFNANEGAFFMIYFNPSHFNRTFLFPDRPVYVDENQFRPLLSSFVKYYPRFPKKLSRVGRDAVVFQYTNWQDPADGRKNTLLIDKAVGDWQFACPVIYAAQKMADLGAPVFMYNFIHRSSRNPWPAWMGVLHADEINFVFGEPLQTDLNYQQDEVTLSRRMMQFWTNFAKFGNPNGGQERLTRDVWPEYGSNRAYLQLSTEHLSQMHQGVQYGPRQMQCHFWMEYLPTLLENTKSISEAEEDWKSEFRQWRDKYIPEWKEQYDKFVSSFNQDNVCR